MAFSVRDRLSELARKPLERIGVLPGPRDRAAAGALDAGASWYWLCVGAWVAMLGPIVAAAPWLPGFCLAMGALLAAAFPAAYYLHYSSVSRWLVNWAVFYAAVLGGAFVIVRTWPAEGIYAFYGLEASFGVLVRAFMWVMAFRAFAIRTPWDIVLTILPAMSSVILVVIAAPTAWAAVGTGMLVGATLYLLAAEHSLAVSRQATAVKAVGRVAWELVPRRGACVNTWQTVAGVVLVAAVLAGAGASYFRSSSELGRAVQIALAQYLAGYLIAEHPDLSPEPYVTLTGEPPPAGNRVVFTVQCERPANWRQQTYAVYDGATWRQVRSRRLRARRVGEYWRVNRGLVSGFRAEGATEVRQRFNLSVPIGAALPGLFLATEVRSEGLSVSTGEDGTIACSGYLRSGQSYEVISLVPQEGPAPREKPLPPLDEGTRAVYLQLPPTLPRRVRDLAWQVIAGTRNQYEAAVAIQNFLADNYPYSLHPPPRPPGRDFVDHFLFDAKKGYCNHYASAMVVMCRAVGLPARYVTGYVPGEYLAGEESYEVRAKDAHSWAEVYIEGRGWQSFEPTPPQEEEERRSVAGLWRRLRSAMADIGLVGWGFVRERRWLLGWLSVAVLSLAAAAALQWRRWYRQNRLAGRGVTPDMRVRFAYAQMLRWLSRFRLARGPAQGPLEYLQSLRLAAAAVYGELARITASYLRARFGPSGVTERDAEEAEEALRSLQGALFRRRVLRKGAQCALTREHRAMFPDRQA